MIKFSKSCTKITILVRTGERAMLCCFLQTIYRHRAINAMAECRVFLPKVGDVGDCLSVSAKVIRLKVFIPEDPEVLQESHIHSHFHFFCTWQPFGIIPNFVVPGRLFEIFSKHFCRPEENMLLLLGGTAEGKTTCTPSFPQFRRGLSRR